MAKEIKLTDSQMQQIIHGMRCGMNTKGIRAKTKAKEAFEQAFLLGVNSALGVLQDADPNLIHLPPFWAMCLMSGRSVEEDDKRRRADAPR